MYIVINYLYCYIRTLPDLWSRMIHIIPWQSLRGGLLMGMALGALFVLYATVLLQRTLPLPLGLGFIIVVMQAICIANLPLIQAAPFVCQRKMAWGPEVTRSLLRMRWWVRCYQSTSFQQGPALFTCSHRRKMHLIVKYPGSVGCLLFIPSFFFDYWWYLLK